MARQNRYSLFTNAFLTAVILLTAVAAHGLQTREAEPAWGIASHVVVPQARSYDLRSSRTPTERVSIETVDAHVVINDQSSRTTIEVLLRNDGSRPAEAVLLLPVPRGVVVTDFGLEGGSAGELSARVLPADEARRTYDAIVAKLMDPGLLEFAGTNLVRSSVFPVPPGGVQRVHLTYEHLLDRTGDRVDYVLPRSESLAARRPWRITVELAANEPVSTVYSPSHEIDARRLGTGRFSITLDDAAQREPGTFRLSWLMDSGDGPSTSIFACPDERAGGGYLLLVVGLPATVEDAAAVTRREVTIVLDRSGSMAGAKMDQVRAAARQVIEGLDDGEAFNVIDYASTVSSFASGPVVKSPETIDAVRNYLARIRPTGGTNIHDALETALAQPTIGDMLPLVLFLTDGLPTIGATSEVVIRDMVERENPHGRRVFTFGVGEDVNVPLLDRVSELTRASSSYVLPDEDVEVAVAQVFKRLYGPVLSEPVLEIADMSGARATRLVQEIMPAMLPDLFVDDQLIVVAQYREQSKLTLTLRGDYLGAERAFRITFDPATATTAHAFVPRLWASRRIGFLVDQVRLAGAAAAARPWVANATVLDDPAQREIIDEIVRLSTEHGILTEYTAFLATEGADLENREELTASCAQTLDSRAVRTRTGKGALNQAWNQQSMKGKSTLAYTNRYFDADLNAVEITSVQQLCDRAFFRRGDKWIDSRLVASGRSLEPDEVVILGTPEHAALLQRFVREGRSGILSLKGMIVLDVDGRTVLVTDGC